MEKRLHPDNLSDDELVERWKVWLQHTKHEAYEFYAFRFKAENLNKMFIENEALQSEGGSSLHHWIFLHEVERFSERVAHRTDAKAPDVTWSDLNRTMNRIFDTYARFHCLVTGSVYVTRYPEPQYNWLQPFTIPWTTNNFVPWEKPNEPEGQFP